MFRPSDDATKYAFHVPSNFFAVASLRQLAEMSDAILSDPAFAQECRMLADQVEKALKEYAVVEHPKHGPIYAYEVDGMGHHLLMDDANAPNLLGMPYLKCCDRNDPIYEATRTFALSEDNPYYYKGSAAAGVGSPHTAKNSIWPLGLIMQAMTSQSRKEIEQCLKDLKASHANTGFMHESFNKDNPAKYTRKWFAWANTLFGEMMLKVSSENEFLVHK
jgi:meiotically up-regulated gene 157 (Mug157) protein